MSNICWLRAEAQLNFDANFYLQFDPQVYVAGPANFSSSLIAESLWEISHSVIDVISNARTFEKVTTL